MIAYKKRRLPNKLYILAFYNLMATSTLFLFFQQCFTNHTTYQSDTPAHINSAIGLRNNDASGYSLLHSFINNLQLVLKKIYYISYWPHLIMVFTLCFAILATYFFTVKIMKLFIKGLSNFKAHAIAFCLSFSSMLIFNPWAERLMIGNGSINLWHNPTFIVSKLFAVMAVFYFLKLLKDPILRDNLKAYLPFSISLFISMWIKPSFGMSFLPSLGLVFIFLYAKKAISLSFLLRMGFFSSLSIIPFLIILNHVYLDAGTQSTIQILPGLVWGRKSVFIPLSIFLGSGFPLFVTIFYFKKLTIQHIIALTNWFIAITGYYLFAEVGRRLYDGNFGWGYSLSLFFLFFTSLEIIYKNRRNYLFTIANILFFWHFISGVFYFCKILFGYTFY